MVKGKLYLPLQFSEYYQHDCARNFFPPFISLIKALVDKKTVTFCLSFTLSFSEKRPRPKLKDFQWQILTLVKRSEK